MISITRENSSVQPTQSTVDQVDQVHEAEELHIVNETTSGEQGRNKTRPSESANKYKYEIFEGYAGEEYLKDLVREILPAALYRTWAIAVGFQAPGNACYVGAGRIAEKAKRGMRQIQKDRREMELRELLRRYAGPVLVKEPDGTWSRKVRIINDFEGLYDLAYEYHLWKISAEYVEAEWEAAEYIREDEELYEKLIRFDCYRRILVCEKPGPKTELSDLHKAYEKRRKRNEQEGEQSQDGQQEAKTNKYLPKQLIKKSSYEETKNPQSSITYGETDSREDSEGKVFESIADKTIRNDQQNAQVETDTEEQAESKIKEEQPKQEEVRRRDRSEMSREQSNIVETQQKEEMGRETAKEEEEYTIEDLTQNPMTMIAFLLQLNEQERAKQEQQQAKNKKRHHKDQPKRKRLGTPEHLARTITQMVQDLGGNAQYLQSDITRVTKIYWTCTQIFTGFTNVWFLEQLTKAFVKTCKARKVGKRVPYFFATLENTLELLSDERVYIRSEDALYRDGDLKTFMLGLERLYEKSGSHLPYQDWVKQTYL